MRIAPALVLFCAALVHAQVIDFETLPDGSTPTDNRELGLAEAYEVDGVMVTFGFDSDDDGITDTSALHERAGNDTTSGFIGSSGNDTADPGFTDQLGSWFLRSPGNATVSPDPGTFVIEYSAPVPAVSGEVWDIDGTSANNTEQWEVRVFNSAGGLVDTVISPLGNSDNANSLDGQPWIFSVADAGGITRVEIEFIGSKTTAIGLAFNNYAAATSTVGPKLLTHQPDDISTEAGGVSEASLYWSEPVTLTEADISVVTADALGQPVPFEITGSGTQVTTITFTGAPGGPDTGSPVPMVNNAYEIIVRDTARATANNAPIDGDGDGVAGGDAGVVVTHRCLADVAPDGSINTNDFFAFLAAYQAGCP